MAIRSTEFKVGLTVLLALALLAWGIVWVKGYQYGREVVRYEVYFDNVGALSTGDPVAVSGVTKGKVVGLSLDQGQVLVTVELDKSISLRSDAIFSVKNIGLMGERYIEIYPGRSELPLATDVPTVGQFDTGIPEVMGMMGQMITEVRDLVGLFSTSMQGAPESFRRADSTVVDLRETARILVELLTDNRQRIENAAKDMESSAHTLRSTFDRKSAQFDSTVDRISIASERMVVAAAKFDSLSDQLRALANQVDAGEGTLGALVQDPSLYDDLKRAASEIDALVADIRANPKKYVRVNFSIF
jgi:phospholipid/cholesterol/gamma-HCH transport system substrate-binding protein